MVRCLLYFLSLAFLVAILSVTAQAQHNHSSRHHHHSHKHHHHAHDHQTPRYHNDLTPEESAKIKNRMLDNRRRKAELLQIFESGRGNDSTVYVPIQFHIVNKSDGTGGESIKDILANLCRLNRDYKDINVEFYLAGPTRVINQDLLYTNSFGNGMANYFMGLYRVPNVVNIFVGNQIINGQSGGTTLGYYTSGLDIVYAIKSAVRGDGTTLTHELGHFFGLPHTFYGWENKNYGTVMGSTTGRTPTIVTYNNEPHVVEMIPRTGGLENCQIAGDGFCDTDPNYLFGFFGSTYNDGCDYAGTAIDPRGWLFRPEVIDSTPSRFKIFEDRAELEEMWLKNNSTKDRIYPKTLIVVETQYTLNGNTVQLWQDTIGDSDSTDIYCPQNGDDNIIGTGILDVKKGFINLNGHYLDVNVSAPSAPSLSFAAARAVYTVTPSTGNHRVDMDSLRVTNTSTTTSVAAGTNVLVTDVFYNNGTQVSSNDRTYTLPNALAPGESHTFSAVDLRVDAPQLAGVAFGVRTYAPYRAVTGTTSENVMSYYDDNCADQFSPEQGEAMKLDIASRGFATLYPKPTDITITDPAVALHPLDNSIAPQPLVHFAWNAVNGATMYYVNIYEINIFGAKIPNGESYEFMVTGTDAWKTLTDGKRYEWVVTPVNATTFCDPSLESTKAKFEVFNWNVGVEKLKNEIQTSKIYPNPSQKEDVILEVVSSVVGDAQISVLNSIGQEVMPTQIITLDRGTNVQKLSTADLVAGLYVINIKTKNEMFSHKLVIKE